MADDKKALGLKLYKRADSLRQKRASIFDPAVQEIYDYFMPDLSDVNTDKTEGISGWFDRLYDSAPIRAVSTCSVGIRNWVTPSTEPWLDLSPPPGLAAMAHQLSPRVGRIVNPQAGLTENDGQDDATRWCAEEAAGILQDLQSSNFYAVIQPFNKAACTAGTALLFCDEGKVETFCFEQFKFGTYVVAENDQKIVDTVFRWFKLTVRQAEQKWGRESLTKKMRADLEKDRYDTEYTFIHCVFPNEDYKAGSLEKAVASVYLAAEEKQVIDQNGFEEMPYFCLRFTRWGTDNQPYGCSPAFETLPEARQINFVTQYQDSLTELKAFPRLVVPDSITGEVEMAAGGATVVKSDDMARGIIPKEWATLGESTEVIAMLERKEKAINEAFFVDIFKALGLLENKDMTYGEVAARMGEKLDQFTGTFDQYRTELINPLVPRLMGIRLRSGRSRTPPEALMVRRGNDPKSPMELAVPKIEINSRVTLVLKEVKNAGLQKTMVTLQPIAETHPEIWDNYDLDKVVRGASRGFGLPEEYFRTMKQVIELRAERKKMIDQQRAIESAQGIAKAGKDLGRSPQKMQDAVMNQMPNAG